MAGAVSQIVAAARKRRDAGAEVRGQEEAGETEKLSSDDIEEILHKQIVNINK